MVELRNIRDPHPPEFECKRLNAEAGHAVILLLAGLQKRERFNQRYLRVKLIGLRV